MFSFFSSTTANWSDLSCVSFIPTLWSSISLSIHIIYIFFTRCAYFFLSSFLAFVMDLLLLLLLLLFCLYCPFFFPPSSVLYAKHTDGFHNIAFDYMLLPFVLSHCNFSLLCFVWLPVVICLFVWFFFLFFFTITPTQFTIFTCSQCCFFLFDAFCCVAIYEILLCWIRRISKFSCFILCSHFSCSLFLFLLPFICLLSRCIER